AVARNAGARSLAGLPRAAAAAVVGAAVAFGAGRVVATAIGATGAVASLGAGVAVGVTCVAVYAVVVLVLDGSDLRELPPPLRRRALGDGERGVARRADVTIGASRDLAERARSLGARRAVDCPVAAPPLAPPTKSAAEVRSDLDVDDRPLVVAVGRLSAQKR